jgi:hypothetical protein
MVFIMAVAGKEDDKVAPNFIDEAVLPDNPARPYYLGPVALKLLRTANPLLGRF